MDDQTDRRQFITALGAGSLALTAGCTDQFSDATPGGDDNGEDSDDTAPVDDNEEQDATPPAIDHGEVVDDFEDLDEWAALEGDITPDEDEALTGSQVPRIENAGNVAGMFRAYPDGLDMEGHHLSLAVRVENPRPVGITVRILAPGEADQLESTRTIVGTYEGWLRMDVGYTNQVGEPFLDDVQEIQILIESQDEEEIRFWVDDLRMTPAADQGYVMLTFDDGVESQYENALPLLEERGMSATASVVPDSLNREDRMTIDHLREMRDAGWDISSHPEGEAFMELNDPESIRQVIESDYEYLDERGFPDGARSMFVPYHNTNEEVVEITREYHDLSSYFGGTPNAVPFTDPMHLSRVDMHDLEGFTSMIDIAEEHNQLAIGLAHGIVPENEIEDDPLADMTTEELEELLDYIEESDVQVVTPSDLLDSQEDL
ncbi:polysaccharide deacetylase family protein [Halalkalicoccus tibetensis]|uniref:Polysaccharide deacetylase family protein n=1 Tax=Halalkalicoccus tibetensis TaxID=175632 RepID=A0ABD5V646_9EURY